MKSLSENVFYNGLLMFFNITYPLLTASYISRILGAENLGLINYSQSIINFLLVLAMVGIPTYGIREIAKVRDNNNEKENVFSELFIIKTVFSIMTFLLYLCFLLFYDRFQKNFLIFFIMGFNLLMNIFNIDWFFSGIEDYKVLSLRNVFIKIIIFAGIIFSVKKQEDYYLYVIFLVLGQGLGNIWSFFLFKEIY